MTDRIRKLALRDGRYSPHAFAFLYDALEVAVRKYVQDAAEGADRHISGQELLDGLRGHALETFGPLAAHVWRSWGIKSSLDWGRIVFLLVEDGLLRRQESDTLEDFSQTFDFDEVFVEAYRPPLPNVRAAGPSRGREET